MVKIIMFSLFVILTSVNAGSIESEIGINIGINSTKNEKGNKFKNPSLGLTYQDNKYVVAPRVDIDYTNVNHDYANSLVKVSVNGVYEYENKTYTIPYALAGVGYEYVSGATKGVFESHPFVQGGVGVRVDLEKGFKARVEAKALQVIGGNDEGNEFMLTAGVSMPLFQKVKAKPRAVIRPVVRPIVRPAPRPIIIQTPIVRATPIVRQTPIVLNSNNNECSIKINAPDLDRDGITDKIDQCPATPCNFTVDKYGCPVKTTLKVNFATNSAEIRGSSQFQVSKFAQYLLQNRGSMVKIFGYTDSRGSAKKNLQLSKRRANAIVYALQAEGVSLARLEAIGRGESMPIASNKTADGRAMNRRIEAELFYPRGRR